MISADEARKSAQHLLASELPRRWAHTQCVAERARRFARVLGEQAELVEAAAWLHDIGYAAEIVSTGLHSLDGARYLRDVLQAPDLLCRLVAHHTCAAIEAEERGFPALSDEFAVPPADLLDALTCSDMTSSVDGAPTNVEERLSEILVRYPADHAVHRSVSRSAPVLKRAVHDMDRRLKEA